ncbi:MAG: ATP-binding protein [Actinomycetales bacterium]|nr:ATP-binding protein [Actinomycetales bacterium]
MSEREELIGRRIMGVALDRMRDEPVVLLEGPRSVGKSTLLRALARRVDGEVLDLDDLATRDAVLTDPATMIAGDRLTCIDEYQRAPSVLDAIKAELNRSSRPGQFLLTGSARHESLPAAAQALTGRLHRMPIYPFAQSELEGTTPDLLATLFAAPTEAVSRRTSSTTREDYIARITRGGFPLALTRETDSARHRWFDDYLRLTLERDVRELSKIRQARALPALLQRLAGQTAQVLNATAAASGTGIDLHTARDYLRLLENVFLVYQLPAWGKTLTKRSSASPKIHVLDSGVAARLLRLTPEKLARRDPTSLTELGHLLETFVVGELLKEASWMDGISGAGHWRTYDGAEVALVVERDDGAIVAAEIKAASRVPGDEFSPLSRLRDAVGDAFIAGVVLYTGARGYTYDDRLHAMPIDRLWASA